MSHLGVVSLDYRGEWGALYGGYSLSFCSFGHLPIKFSRINESSPCETLVRSNYLQRVLNTTHDASSFYVAIMRVRGRELETQRREGGREGEKKV